MNWTKHNEKLNGLYKGNNIGFKAFVCGIAFLIVLLIGCSNNQSKMDNCIDGLFNGEFTDANCETCEKLINRK
jgi:hypothetical protein